MDGLSSTAKATTNGFTDFTTPGQSMNFLQAHIKGQLIDRLRTGDPIYDTIIAFILLSSQDVLLKYICKFKDMIIYRVPWLLKLVWRILCRYLGKEAHEMTEKTAVIRHITDGREINTLFTPVLWYLNSLTDTRQEDNVEMQTTKNSTALTQTVPQNRTAEVKFLNHKIRYTISTEMITIYADREHKRENLVITLRSHTPKSRKQDILEQFAEMCIQKHEEYDRKKEWKQTIHRNTTDCGWTGKPTKNNKMRKLNTVVLKDGQMSKLVKDLTAFLQDEEWYLSRDVPYTRGYMFYGVPGTGKSSCIKALAGYTKRHIHYLILSEVKSDADLFRLMEKVDYAETILVIEDIDCASSVTNARPPPSYHHDDQQSDDDQEEDKKDLKIKSLNEDKGPNTSSLTLGGLLNALDGGIIESHGRILVVTTNHPDRLDPALIRPGRIDMKFNFGLCDDFQIRGLYHNFFEIDAPNPEILIPSDLCSPADVTSILLEYKNDIKVAWEKVKETLITQSP